MYKASVLNHFGGTVKTAGALGISHSAVCQWGEVVPEKQALRIEKITKGRLKYDQCLYTQKYQNQLTGLTTNKTTEL